MNDRERKALAVAFWLSLLALTVSLVALARACIG